MHTNARPLLNQFSLLKLHRPGALERAVGTLRLCVDLKRNGPRPISYRELDLTVGTGADSKLLRGCFVQLEAPKSRLALGYTLGPNDAAVRLLSARVREHLEEVKRQLE
jgi:hypothetical protein